MAEAVDSTVSTWWNIGAKPSYENCYELNIFYYGKIVQKMEKKFYIDLINSNLFVIYVLYILRKPTL